jgi:hypothetical protein
MKKMWTVFCYVLFGFLLAGVYAFMRLGFSTMDFSTGASPSWMTWDYILSETVRYGIIGACGGLLVGILGAVTPPNSRIGKKVSFLGAFGRTLGAFIVGMVWAIAVSFAVVFLDRLDDDDQRTIIMGGITVVFALTALLGVFGKRYVPIPSARSYLGFSGPSGGYLGSVNDGGAGYGSTGMGGGGAGTGLFDGDAGPRTVDAHGSTTPFNPHGGIAGEGIWGTKYTQDAQGTRFYEGTNIWGETISTDRNGHTYHQTTGVFGTQYDKDYGSGDTWRHTTGIFGGDMRVNDKTGEKQRKATDLFGNEKWIPE